VTHHEPGTAARLPEYALGPADEPPLESVQPPRWARAGGAAVGTAWLTLFTVVGLLASTGLRENIAVTVAIGVVFIGVVFIGLLFHERRPPAAIVAGARWVGLPGTANPVRLYELTWVTTGSIRVQSDSTTKAEVLRLTDGRASIELEPPLLEANPALWDLVYHGIRHSAAAGATIEPAVRERLGLAPGPPDRNEVSDRDLH
jgi:hypothetical protein